MKKMYAICAGVLVSLSLLVSLPAFGGGGVFRAVDDKMVLRIVGPTEAEISMDGENYVCSYTEQGGEIRAVLEIHGTKKALYFNRVEVGLKDRDGVTLYDSAHYDTVMRKVSAERRQKDLNKRLLKATDENNFSDAVAAVKAGADINTSNSNGAKAIHFAAACGNPDLVRFLLEHGATPNIRTVSGDTPLYFAATGTRRGLRANRKTAGYDKTLKILIENGANLDAQNRNSVTPLMKAMFKKYREGIRILVEAGANRTIKTYNGKTVWDYGPHAWLRTSKEAARYKKVRTETKQVGTCKDVKRTTGRAIRGGVIVTDVSVKPTTYGQFGGKGVPVYFMDLSGPPKKEPYPNAMWGWNGFKVKLSAHSNIVFRSESARDECYDIIIKAYQECVEKFKE